jgi:hypothetical protein
LADSAVGERGRAAPWNIRRSLLEFACLTPLRCPTPRAGVHTLAKIVRVSKDAVVRGVSLLGTVLVIGYQVRLKLVATESSS